MCIHGGQHQLPVTGQSSIHLAEDTTTCLHSLQLDKFAKLVRLSRFSLAYDFRVRFKQTDQLVWKLGQASEDSCLGLPYHSAYLIGHGLQPFTQSAHPAAAMAGQSVGFLQHPA